MYGLPPDFDTAIFIGRVLEQVSFTVNTVHLAFADDMAITLASTFVFQPYEAAQEIKQAPPVQESSLMALVGQQIRAAAADRDGTLRLIFAAGGALTCIDDSAVYESYSIRMGGKEIIV